MVANPTHPPVTYEQAERVWRLVVDEAAHAGPDGGELVRQAAVITVARATGGRARMGELASLDRIGLDLSAGSLTMVHAQPRTGVQYVRTYPLGDPAVLVMRRWLRVRRRLVFALSPDAGLVRAMFVTTVPSTRPDGSLYPAGLPLHRDGMISSHRRLVARLHAEQAGAYGWEPLPGAFDRLRRAWA